MVLRLVEFLSLDQGPSAGKWQNWSANQGSQAPKSLFSMIPQYCKVEKESTITFFLTEGFFLEVQKPKGELVLVSLHTSCLNSPSQSPGSQSRAVPEAQAGDGGPGLKKSHQAPFNDIMFFLPQHTAHRVVLMLRTPPHGSTAKCMFGALSINSNWKQKNKTWIHQYFLILGPWLFCGYCQSPGLFLPQTFRYPAWEKQRGNFLHLT